jgi:hypothetical protein
MEGRIRQIGRMEFADEAFPCECGEVKNRGCSKEFLWASERRFMSDETLSARLWLSGDVQFSGGYADL